jgi:hypothetical protein
MIYAALIMLVATISGCVEQSTEEAKVTMQNASFIVDNKTISSKEFVTKYNQLSSDYSSLKRSYEANITLLNHMNQECDNFLAGFKYWFLEKFNHFNMQSDYGYTFKRWTNSIDIEYDKNAEMYHSTILCATDSMRPTFDCNDIIWGYRPKSPDSIKEGDIIAFRNNPLSKETIAHRVINVEKKSNGEYLYTTSGDNKINQMAGGTALGGDADEVKFNQIEFKVAGVVYG